MRKLEEAGPGDEEGLLFEDGNPWRGPEDAQCIKVLHLQISWHKGELHWEADPRHVEILARQVGLENGKVAKTPGDKNALSKEFRHRD